MMPIRILHLIEGLRKEDGGPVVSLRNLVGATASELHHTLGYQWAEQETLDTFPVEVKTLSLSQGAGRGILESYDLVHVHGMWSCTQAKIAVSASSKGIPVVVSPRGMLEPWSLTQSRWKKRVFLVLIGNRMLRNASVVHATALMEGGHFPPPVTQSQVRVLPNIVEGLPVKMTNKPSGNIRALFLSRIHEKKGIFDLIPAWGSAAEGTSHTLTICGPGEEKDIDRAKTLIQQCPDPSVLQYRGPAFGEEKVRRFSEANVFLLPSYSENYGNVVPEALSAGLPVLTTTGLPWDWLEAEGCGWTITPGSSALSGFLDDLFQKSPERLSDMSKKAASVFVNRLAPSLLAGQYMEMYQDLIT